MQYRPILLFVLSFLTFTSSAQLVLDGTLTPTQLVEDVLLGGGVTASNITFNGVPAPGISQEGTASFTATGTTLGLVSGILLTTGYTFTVPAPAFDISGDDLLTGPDDDLALLINGTALDIYDSQVLEFDFVPNGESLSFRYVFASEEYPDYVCSMFNDAFGFFISGPGIMGPYSGNAMNIALLPGSTVPVTINTVNNGVAGISGDPLNCAASDPNWLSNTVYFVDNSAGGDIIYNGFTVVLESTVDVICGETYHFKIAIGDVGDGYLDSGVFLEAGSFTSPGQVTPELQAGVGIVDDTIMEGCGPVEFVFTREGDLTMGSTVDLAITGTATAGVDYDPPFPAQITFAAGEATQSVFLDVPMDGDLQETIIITVGDVLACAGINAEFTFFIENTPPLVVTMDDITVSCGSSGEFLPDVTGGVGDYQYLWDNGDITSTLIVSPLIDTQVELTVSDACGVTPVTITAMANINDDPLTIELSPDLGIVCGEQEDITVIDLTGGDGVYTYIWTYDGFPVGNSATLTVLGEEPGYYYLTATEGCGSSIQDSVLVTQLAPAPVQFTVDPAAELPCDGSIEVSAYNVTGGNGEYVYEWTYDGAVVGTDATLDVTGIGWYVVTVSEGCGGSEQDSVEVSYTVYDPIAITVSDDLQLPCQGNGQISMSASGGSGQYSYDWSFNGSSVSQNATYQVTGGLPSWYIATVTDNCDNVVQDSVFVTALSDVDLIVEMADDVTVVCPGDIAELSVVSVDGGTGTILYTWTDQNGTIVGGGQTLEVVVAAAQTYTVTASDVCTNSGTGTISTILPYNPLFDVVLPADTIICAGEELDLLALVTGGSGYYFLEWQGLEHTDPVLPIAPTEDTWYAVTVIDECGATTNDAVLVQVEHVSIDIQANSLGQDDWHLRAVSSPQANTWIWDMGDSTRYRTEEVMHSYMDLEDHWVMLNITTPNGCEAVDSILIEPPAHIYFPNAFTPDGDGLNDEFGAVAHNITEFELFIFDRWGEVIFQTTDIQQFWDGSVGGSSAMTGVYIYKYKAAGHFLTSTEGVGHVTLLAGDIDY